MVEEVIKLTADISQANKGISQVNANVNQLQAKVEDTSDSTKKIAGGFKLVGTAIKAAGVGLVVAAFAKLGEVMSENQKFADFFSRQFIALKAIFMEVVNVLTPLIGAFKALLSGDWKTMSANFSELGHNVMNFTKNIRETTAAAYEFADAMVEMEKKSRIAEAEGKKLMLIYQLQAEQMRQIRDDESRTIEERIRANQLLGVLLEKQMQVELRNAGTKLKMAKMNLEQNKDNVDAIVAVTLAETELIDIRERITGQRSEQLTNENALLREQAEMQVKSVAVVQDTEAQKIQAKISATRHFVALEQKQTDAAYAAYQQRKEIAQMEADAKVQIMSVAVGAIADLFGRESAAGKAAAIAQATINTYQAATNALANTPLPPPFPQIAAGATIVAGLAQVRQIIQTKIPNGFGGGFGMVSPGLGAAPSITIPGQSGINSIVAGFQNNNGPVQAYVLAGQVTSAQELERKKLANATFG